jgi:hypothetical protein
MVIASKRISVQIVNTLSHSFRHSVILRYDSCEGRFRWIHYSKAPDGYQTHLSTHRVNGAGWSNLLFLVRHSISTSGSRNVDCLHITRMLGVFTRQ